MRVRADSWVGFLARLAVCATLGATLTDCLFSGGRSGSSGCFGAGCTVTDDAGGETPPGTCADANLGSALGAAVVTRSTVGGVNRQTPSCSSSGTAPDVTFQWTAPSSGTYRFTTVGSSFDTVLTARRGTCAGAEVACNDDGSGTASVVSFAVAEGEVVFLTVDGFGAASGNAVLNIEQAVGPVDAGTVDTGVCHPLCPAGSCSANGCGGICPCPSGQMCSGGSCTVATGIPSTVRVKWFQIVSDSLVGMRDLNGMSVGGVNQGSTRTWQRIGSLPWQFTTTSQFTYSYNAATSTLDMVSVISGAHTVWRVLGVTTSSMQVMTNGGSTDTYYNCNATSVVPQAVRDAECR